MRVFNSRKKLPRISPSHVIESTSFSDFINTDEPFWHELVYMGLIWAVLQINSFYVQLQYRFELFEADNLLKVHCIGTPNKQKINALKVAEVTCVLKFDLSLASDSNVVVFWCRNGAMIMS